MNGKVVPRCKLCKHSEHKGKRSTIYFCGHPNNAMELADGIDSPIYIAKATIKSTNWCPLYERKPRKEKTK